MSSKPWGIILAGGDGTRLRELSLSISGDSRPKQFCTLFGGRSLLARTRLRLMASIDPGRLLYSVVRSHERYYRPELADVEESRIVVQPANRGTTAAIVYSLLRLTRFEKDAVTGIFPADHHFANESRFAHSLSRAFAAVRMHPEKLVLLGAPAQRPETGYGWIEPGVPLGDGSQVCRVDRFREKPPAAMAESLLQRGCLWNTFVVVGRARAFLEILEESDAVALAKFRAVAECRKREEEASRAAALYEWLPSGDFSHQVLTHATEKLAVLRMEDAGWRDLGTPEAVLEAMRNTGVFNNWLAGYQHKLVELCRPAATRGAGAE